MSYGEEPRFEQIKLTSAYEMIAEAIERQITSGRLKPGDEVGTEAELVRQFGVNRSTVREGIRVLEQSGLVRRAAGRKLFVSLPQYRGLSTRLSRALVISEVTFRELFEATMVLELAAVEAAVERATDEDLAALAENQAQAERLVDDPVGLADADTTFHALVARASHNRVLELAREPAALLFFPTSELICRQVAQGGPRMVAAHRHIVEAIRSRDAEQAKLWMRRHVRDWLTGFERAGRNADHPVERSFDATRRGTG